MDKIQSQIDQVAFELSEERVKLNIECGVKKNEAFSARTKALKDKAPKDFWWKVFKGHPDFSGQLLGPYDERIFAALENFEVLFTPTGYKVEMTFGPNDYFTDTSLWFEEIARENEDELKTSGVHWKPGKGPLSEDELVEEEKKKSNPWVLPQQQQNAGQRREREEEERGNSFFTFFEAIPEMPQPKSNSGGGGDAAAAASSGGNKKSNDGDDDGDDFMDEGFGDADSQVSEMNDWEDMIDERKEIARCLIEEIWEDPAEYLK